MRGLVLSSIGVLLVLLSSCSSVTQLKSSEEYWAETEFDWADVQKIINDENCHQEAEKFFSCIEATNSLMALGKEKWFFYPVKKSDTNLKYPAHFAQIQFPKSLKIIKRSRKNIKSVKADIGGKDFNNTYKKSWGEYFEKGQRVPFNQIFQKSINYLNTTKDMNELNRNLLASAVYNKYLENLLGKYTYLVPRQQLYDRYSDDKKTFAGLGIMLQEVEEGLLVNVVYPNTPAEKSGIQEGDVITSVVPLPGAKKVGMNNKRIEDAVDLIRGPVGSVIELEILRSKQKISKKSTRANVVIEPIIHSVNDVDGKKILHLRINSFYREMFCPKVERIIRTSKPYDGIILDLRSNRGGSGESAFCLTGFFLEEGKTILKDVHLRHGLKHLNQVVKEEVVKSEGKIDTKTPLVVFVTSESASSSEVVASALQDHGRAVVIGETTYGKGTGLRSEKRHEQVPYMEDEEDLFIYYVNVLATRPSGSMIEGVGVTPDVFVRPSLKRQINSKPGWKRQVDDFYWGYVSSFGDGHKATQSKSFFKEKDCMRRKVKKNKRLYGTRAAMEMLSCYF